MRTTTLLTVPRHWPGLAQGCERTRERTVKGQTSVEVVSGSTRLRPEQADAARLLALVRAPWRIENSLHDVRAGTLGEDACRVRQGSAPQVLAALRNVVIHLWSGVEAENRGAVAEQLAARPNEALSLLGHPPLQ